MPHFFMLEFFEMPHFSYLILKMGKMGHFKKFEHKKVGHFEKLARDQFLNRKLNSSILGHFKKNMKMLSREKILFHMLFWASHGTPRTSCFDILHIQS